MRTESTDQPPIREAIGIFFARSQLNDAVDELMSSGFDPRGLGLLTSEEAVRGKLGAVYRQVPRSEEDAQGPRLEFVTRDSIGDVAHAGLGGLFFVGTTTATGVAVASAAVLGGALIAAAAGAAAIGAVGGVLAMIIHESDAEYLREQIDEGHLLLFVRTSDAHQERRAVEILARHSGYDARVHTIDPRAHHFLRGRRDAAGGGADGRIDIRLALLDPKAVFATPEEVYEHARLTTPQKIAILESWSYDETELATATDEGMPPAIPVEDDVHRRILSLLRELHAAARAGTAGQP